MAGLAAVMARSEVEKTSQIRRDKQRGLTPPDIPEFRTRSAKCTKMVIRLT